jgi:hypothetical protein
MEEESLVRERIDPAYLRLVLLVSSPTRPELHVEGLRILAHLCRRALQRSLPLNQMTPVAECEFTGVATLCRGEEEARYGKWPYSRETTLKWFVLLEALSVIRRFRRKGKTVIQIPLGKREPLSQAQLLHNLDEYASKYTNSKTAELLMRAKADIERYGFPSPELEEGDFLDQPALQTVPRQLVEKLQECGVSRATSRKVALWLTGGPLAQLAKNHLHAVRTATGKAIPPQHDASAPAHTTRGDQFGSEQGDSAKEALTVPRRFFGNEVASLECFVSESAHSLPSLGDFELQKVAHQTAKETPREQSRLACDLLSAEQGDFQRAQPSTATAVATAEIALLPRQGDSAVAISNSNSTSFPKDLMKESEFEFDTATQHEERESPASSAERRTEAMDLWRQLYSEEQRNTAGGQRLIGGLITRLKERPDLVRLAMVNVLMQRFFPDRHGPPEGGGAKWFYRSYARYLSGQLTPSPEITSWAESPYSYEQIERTLQAEYVYQQADVFGKPHRPSASCIVEHHLSAVLDGTLREAPQENQTTEHDAAPTAFQSPQAGPENTWSAAAPPEQQDTRQSRRGQGSRHQGEQGREAHEAPVAVHEDSMGTPSQANQSQTKVYKQKVVVVEDPQAGWTSLSNVLWWHEKATSTSLSASCRIEILPTEYGRYVLVVTPYEDEAAAWFWSNGRQVRLYLEQLRTARV